MLYRRCSPPSVNSRSLCLRTTTSSTHPPCTGSRSRAGPGFWALRKTAKSWRATVWRKPSPRHTSSPGLLKVLELQPVGVLNKYRLGCMYALLSAAALEAVLMKDVTSGAKLKDAFLIWFILSIIWLFFNCPVNMELHLEETKKKNILAKRSPCLFMSLWYDNTSHCKPEVFHSFYTAAIRQPS